MQPDVDIARVIQLSVAPVFLIASVGGLLNVLAHRLSRIIDRSRALEAGAPGTAHVSEGERHNELVTLKFRAKFISRAIALSTLSALLVSVVIMTLFVEAVFLVHAQGVVAALFVAAMVVLVAALVYFLREIFLATQNLRGPLR
jgi:butyrate kinase